jgi:Triose-phosphate Transporter family
VLGRAGPAGSLVIERCALPAVSPPAAHPGATRPGACGERRRRRRCAPHAGAVQCAASAGAEGLSTEATRPARPVSALTAGRNVKRLVKNAFLVLSFLLWYGGNISFNIYNKQLLRAFSHPAAVSTLYMGVGAILGWLSWRLGLVRQPSFSKAQLVACVPLAVCHALTNTLMLTSLHAVAVSLSHTIRVRSPRPRCSSSGLRVQVAQVDSPAATAPDPLLSPNRQQSLCL